MPQYLSPGVYIEELDVGPHPIQGVSTSTTGMVGVTVRGPTGGKPVLVTTFNDYQRIFGGFLPVPDASLVRQWGSAANLEGGAWWLFPLAVKAFFDNGGQLLYVKRVFSGGTGGATAASGSAVSGLTAEVTQDAAVGATSLVLRHLFGIQKGTQVNIFTGGDTAQNIGSPTVATYDWKSGTITFAPALTQEVRVARGDVVEIVATSAADPTVPANATATFQAQALGSWGKDLRAQIRPMVGATMSILPSPAAGKLAITALSQEVPAGIAQVVVPEAGGTFDTSIDGNFVVIAGHRFQASAATVSDSKLTFTISPATHLDWKPGLAVQRLRTAMPGVNTQLSVNGAQKLYTGAIVELDNGTQQEISTVASVSGNVVTFKTALNNAYVETDSLRVVEAEVLVRYQPAGGQLVSEDIANLRIANAGSTLGNDPNSLWVAVNAQSQLVTLEQGAAFSTNLNEFPTASPHGGWLTLTGGEDHPEALTVEDFVGADGGSGHRTGIQALEDIDEIAICTVPGIWSQTVQSSLIDHCELLKDRFAILDPPDGEDIGGIGSFRQVLDTQYAALYYPWCITVDPSTGSNVHVPPSGFLAGIYADTDNEPRGAQGAGERGDPRHQPGGRAGRGHHQTRAGRAQSRGHQRTAVLPRAGRTGVGRADAVLGHGLEVHQRPAAVHLRGEVDLQRHPVGRLRAQQRAVVGAGPAVDKRLPHHGLADRRAGRDHPGPGVLRSVRPHHDEPGRSRQRAADLHHRARSRVSRGIRHLPLRAEDGQQPAGLTRHDKEAVPCHP